MCSGIGCFISVVCIFGLILSGVGILCIVKFSDCDLTTECTYDKDGILVYKGQEVKHCQGQPGHTIHCHWEDGKDCPTLDNCKTTAFLVTSIICLVTIIVGCIVFGLCAFLMRK